MHSNRSYCVGLRSLPLWQLGIARHQYIRNIDDGEMTLADRGYADSEYFVTPRYYPGSGYKQKQIMARHETANARLKNFGVICNSFRHDIHLHASCFHAVVNIVQLRIENGSPLFSVQV